jgi:hypothetical protein
LARLHPIHQPESPALPAAGGSPPLPPLPAFPTLSHGGGGGGAVAGHARKIIIIHHQQDLHIDVAYQSGGDQMDLRANQINILNDDDIFGPQDRKCLAVARRPDDPLVDKIRVLNNGTMQAMGKRHDILPSSRSSRTIPRSGPSWMRR